MNQDGESLPSPIDGLSVELVRMILSAAPDVASLRAAVVSCPLFYRAFREVETEITATVLLNQIDFGVLPEAIAASESSRLRPHDKEPESREAILRFVDQNLRQRRTPPRSWPLREALRLGRLHFYVDSLAKMFASATLTTKHPLDQSEKSAATREELCRVERALYRFEIYCNLFRESPRVQSTVYGEQKRLFFNNFAPWENEQLGCIHDFLARVVSPAFNDIAEHDIAWGAFQVEYGDRVGSPYIQHLLSLGLEKLHQIAAAETDEERHRLLYRRSAPSATECFLHEGLQDANKQNHAIYLDELPADGSPHIKQPFFPDPDSGPYDIWRWAHQDESWAPWIYQENREDLRRWGYVMCDLSRLESVGILWKPWEDPDDSRDLLADEQEAGRQRAYMQNSWEAREKIYRSGGTGWWSWGDHSKVKPPDRVHVVPRQGVGPSFFGQNMGVPSSLEEARETLAMMNLPPSAR